MLRIFALALLLTTFSTSVVSQTSPPSDSKKLTDEVVSLYNQGRFDESIQLAEKVVGLVRAAKPPDAESLANAILNLALIQKAHYWLLRKDLGNPTILSDAMRTSSEKRVAYEKSVPVLLREAISIFEKELKREVPNLATAKFELASFIYRGQFVSSRKKQQFEDFQRDFSESIALLSRVFGPEDDKTAYAILIFADKLKELGEIESAATKFEDYIRIVRSTHGAKSEFLIPAMRSLALLFFTTYQQDRSEELVNQISVITGKPETAMQADFDLTDRTKKDYLALLLMDPKTITTGMKKQKSLRVNIVVDENGSVVEALPADFTEKDAFGKDVRKAAANEVREWKFRPYSKGGAPAKMRGFVWFPYFVKG